MQAQSARQYDSELLNKLALSQLAAEELIKREIKCPVCGFYLMDVYGRDHHITRVSAVSVSSTRSLIPHCSEQ